MKEDRKLSLPLEEKDGKVKILCPCPCHGYDGMIIHIVACCQGGYIWIDKEKLKEKLKDD